MFPGARADRGRADYVIVGAPLDVSTSFRPGTRFGPERIRRFARTFEDYHHPTQSHFSECGVHDHGDIHAWDDAAEYLEYLEGVLTDVYRDDATPLLFGGEHTVSVAGVRAADPDVFVVLDAHLDLREDLDGNPLSHATVTRHALDVATEVVVIGARAGNETEWDRAAADDVTVVPPEDASEWTPGFESGTAVYLSVDIDAADPAFAPGTGTVEPAGLDSRTMRNLVRTLAPQATAFDVVEVNDRDDGQAATLGAKLLREFVHTTADG